MDFIRKLAEKYGPEVSKGKAGEGKEGEKGVMKRRKQAEGETPSAPAAAAKQ
jgi:hypothetical protein